MALTSNIVIDNASNTLTLTATVGADSVETFVYDNATNEVTISARAGVIINFTEFLSFCDQVNIFETAILFNFQSVNIAATKPFVQLIVNEFHDVGAGNWNLTVSPFSGSNVCEYEGTKSSLKLDMSERTGDVTLTFPEWNKFLIALNHYRLSIKGF